MTAKDLTFLKMRNICAMHEFIIIHLKRYLADMNFRMVYKLLGLKVPKKVIEILKRKGADFTDYWPASSN